MEKFKSGFVSLIGKTNSGKSTLLNSLVGEKVATNIISASSGNAKVHSGGGGVYGKILV